MPKDWIGQGGQRMEVEKSKRKGDKTVLELHLKKWEMAE